MIQSFKHKGLQRCFDKEDRRSLNRDHIAKISLILLALESANSIEVMNLPTFRLHRLTGDLKGYWSVTVSANWRIIFRFEDGHIYDVDLIDYH